MQTATNNYVAPHRRLYKPITAGRVVATETRQPLRRVTVALDAFPETPQRSSTRDVNNADYWEAKAREHISLLCAAVVLHKQLTSGDTVPRSLTQVLIAGQSHIGDRIKTAIRRHVINGGTQEKALNAAWWAAV